MIILVPQLYLLAQSAIRWLLWKPDNTDEVEEKIVPVIVKETYTVDKRDETINFPFLCDRNTISYIQNGKTMFIMRGVSGSGKSTIVNLISNVYGNALVCSADQYFMKKGVYQFDHTQLSYAHDKCCTKATKACLSGTPVVVVDNTNVKRWEMGNYLNLAVANNYTVVIIKPKTPWSRDADKLAEFNKHGVTADIIRGKLRAFEDVTPLYYGWFLNQQDSDLLYELARKCLLECVTQFPQLKDLIIFQSPEVFSEIGKALDDCVLKCKEWYGYHFPELKYVINNASLNDVTYARVVNKLEHRRNIDTTDLSDILSTETADRVKKQAKMSMGGDIADEDIILIKDLCEQIIEMWEYREQTEEFVRNPAVNKTPNVTKHVWEVIGQLLISNEDKFEETLRYMFKLNLHKILHCTAKFMGTKRNPAQNSDKYGNMSIVQRSYGSAMTITITRLTVSPRTIGAEVKLSHDCLQLYDKPQEKEREINLKQKFGDQVTFEFGCAAHVTIGTAPNIPPVKTNDDLLDILEEEAKCKLQNTTLSYVPCSVGTATHVCQDLFIVNLDKPITLQGLYSGFYGGNFGSPHKK